MLNIYFLIDLFVVIALIALGLLTFLKNRYLVLNRIFIVFCICISVWIMANYISNDLHNPPQVATVATYFVFGFSFAAAFLLNKFVIILTGDKKAASIIKKCYIPLLLVGVSAFTPLIVKGSVKQDQLYAVTFGPFIYVYFVVLLLLLVNAMYILWRNIRVSEGKQKARLRVLFRSMYISLTLVMVTQSLLPAVTGWFGLTNIGILPMSIMVFGLYYSVVKHGLFNIRLIIARSIGYILSILTLGLAYGAVVFLVINNFVLDSASRTMQEFVFTATAIAMAFTFQSIKLFFDRITRRIFYRDAYDTQAFLDRLNNVLVENIEINKLLTEVTKVIEDNLKASFTLFSIRETSYFDRRIISDSSIGITEDDIRVINKQAIHMREKVIVSDFLEEDHKDLKDILIKNDIAVLVRLVATLDYDVEGVGSIIFGQKKSGNPYNKQDIQNLEIIANELVIAIQNGLRFEEIEKFNSTLQDKVDDATRKLKKINDKLKQMDETKDEFISMASHQLRTPLTSVKGYLSMVLEGDAGEINEMQHKLLDQAFISSQRMVYLIADLLNVSRLRTGKFVIEAVSSNLADVVEGEVHQLIDTATARGLTLTYQKPENFPTVMIDETKIRQVIMNFMDNAIYYSKDDGHINVELKDKGDIIEYTVSDDGIGVPKAEQHHLFTKFYRAANAKKARPDGTGLGLFMAKKVVVAQGGSIIFKSDPGKGSTFGFSFQKSKLAALAEREGDTSEVSSTQTKKKTEPNSDVSEVGSTATTKTT